MRLTLALVLLTSCSMFKDGTISGKVESKGALGDWVLDKGTCFSGQREQYFGAIAYGPAKSGIAIKMVKDPTKGWQVVINNAATCADGAEKANCKAIILTADQCKTLEANVSETNTTVNDVKVVDGHLKIDCTSGNDHVAGELTLSRCH